MQLRILGCSGSIARHCHTTSFVLGEQILIDAGTGVGRLTVQEMQRIGHVFLSHSHLDHVAALPLLADTVGSARTQPLQVYGLPETLDALRAHIFNNVIWPDFTRLPTPQAPRIQLQPLSVGDVLVIGGTPIEVLPARHSVPAVGYAARGDHGWWIYSGDTEGNMPLFWQRVNALQAQAPGVTALVIETAFSNREQALARISQHLAPTSLSRELAQIAQAGQFPIYITHAKPQESDAIMREVQALEQDVFRIIDLQTIDTLDI